MGEADHDVLRGAVQFLLDAAARRGLHADALPPLAGDEPSGSGGEDEREARLPRCAEEPRELVPWVAFVGLLEALEDRLGPGALEEIGGEILGGRHGGVLAFVARALPSPQVAYRLLARPGCGLPLLCAGVQARAHAAGPRRLAVALSFAEGRAPSRAFLRLAKGALAALPTAFGLPPARVRMDEAPAGARYDVTLDPAHPAPAAADREPARAAAAAIVEAVATARTRAIALCRERDLRSSREAALRRSEALLRAVTDSLPFDVFACDAEGRYILQNAASVAHWGNQLGRRAQETGAPQAVAAQWRENNRRALAGEVVRQEVDYVQGGERRSYEKILAPLREDGQTVGRVVGLLGMNVDVTARRRLEEQMLEARNLEAVGRLAGGVAHDFNNLLTIILNAAELAAQALPAGGLAARELGMVREAGQRAAALTTQLLAFARRQRTAPRVLDLGEIVHGLEPLLRRLVREDIALDLAIAPVLAPVRADPAQLEQVLVNLVLNARDALPDGGRIRIAAEEADLDEAQVRAHAGAQPGLHVLLTVEDDGLGMGPETLARIFEPFFTTKQVGRGTGLGLASVYGIVRQAGGFVTVDSAPREGTSFRVYLPAAPGAAREASGGAATSGAAAAARGGGRVLVVEDDPAVLRVTSLALEANGFTVAGASSADAALAQVEALGGRLDLVVTDVVMPGMRGPDLVRTIGARVPGIKALFLSGYDPEAHGAGGLEGPGAGFLAKPFTVGALVAAVRGLLA